MRKIEFKEGSRVRVNVPLKRKYKNLKGLNGIIKSVSKRKEGKAYVVFSGHVQGRFIPIKDLITIYDEDQYIKKD